MALHPDIEAVIHGDSEGCIVCGDCLDVMRDMPDGCIDALVTDPPYGIALENHDRTGKFRRTRSWAINGDASLDSAMRVLEWAGTATVAMFCSPDVPLPGKWRSRLVWHKVGLGMGGDPATCWRRDWEMICVRGNPPLEGGRDSSVLEFQIRPNEFTHPCQKPVALMEYLICKLSADIILDPFCGSGTTCVAAKKLGRKWIGIEIDERYCEIARNRVKNTPRPLFAPEPAEPAQQQLFSTGVATDGAAKPL